MRTVGQRNDICFERAILDLICDQFIVWLVGDYTYSATEAWLRSRGFPIEIIGLDKYETVN